MQASSKPKYLQNLEAHKFHKLIIGAALKDFGTIEHYAYLFTHAGADAIDISAFPHSVISAQKGIKKAIAENSGLTEPLIMVSVNIGQDPHFRRIELKQENCTECLLCVPSCPSEAFSSPQFSYDENLCFGCSACLPACSFDALSFVNWSAFDSKSLSELQALGANAIEIHLNNNLDEFSSSYRSMPNSFVLESFSIGSEQMTKEDLINATNRIIGESAIKHGPERELIIQTDGIPLSGARLEANLDKDLISINNARIVLETIEKFYPKRKNLFVQLAGGITENSFAKASKLGVKVDGVAIGSYARKKLAEIDSNKNQIEFARNLLELSKNFKNLGNPSL